MDMLKRSLILSIICFAFSCKSARDYLNEAAELESQGKLKEAIVLLSEAIDRNPNYLPAYINRGVDESMLGNYKLAIDDYSTVIGLSPNNVLALVNRGRNENRLHEYTRAVKDFQSAINAKGGSPLQLTNYTDGYDCSTEEICLERGVAYYNLDSLKKSFEDFQFCISRHYELGIAYRFRGYIRIASKQNDWGCKDLQQAAELGDKEAVADERKYCH